MDYSFLANTLQPLHAHSVQEVLVAVCPKVEAVTVANHCKPAVIFVRCSENLTENELILLKDGIITLEG